MAVTLIPTGQVEERAALRAVVQVLWDEAQGLPPTSPTRAWLLKIRSPLASFLGVRPFGEVDAQ
jgi:hypothetical protein